MPKPNRAEIEAQIAALQAELAVSDGGVYEDPATGRWFVVLRAPGGRRRPPRRRPSDGSRLLTRAQALVAKGQLGDPPGRRLSPDRPRALRDLLAALSAPRQGRDDPGVL